MGTTIAISPPFLSLQNGIHILESYHKFYQRKDIGMGMMANPSADYRVELGGDLKGRPMSVDFLERC